MLSINMGMKLIVNKGKSLVRVHEEALQRESEHLEVKVETMHASLEARRLHNQQQTLFKDNQQGQAEQGKRKREAEHEQPWQWWEGKQARHHVAEIRYQQTRGRNALYF